MDRLAAMSLFVLTVDRGSLSAAGRATGLPLATVSRRLSDLEAHLGTRLLLRTSRSLTVTEAGRDYLDAARRILAEVEVAERAAAGEYLVPRGQLVVTAPVVFGRLHVLPAVAGFLLRFPEVTVRLVLADRPLHLLDDHVDAALRIGPLGDSSFVAQRVGEVARVVCAAPSYLSRRGIPETPDDLQRHDSVSFDTMSAAGEWPFGRGGAERRVAIMPRLSVTTAEAAIDAAEAGLGLTRVLSYQIASQVRAGGLVTVLDDHRPDPWPVHLVHPGQGALPQKVRAFIDHAAPVLRQRLAEAALP